MLLQILSNQFSLTRALPKSCSAYDSNIELNLFTIIGCHVSICMQRGVHPQLGHLRVVGASPCYRVSPSLSLRFTNYLHQFLSQHLDQKPLMKTFSSWNNSFHIFTFYFISLSLIHVLQGVHIFANIKYDSLSQHNTKCDFITLLPKQLHPVKFHWVSLCGKRLGRCRKRKALKGESGYENRKSLRTDYCEEGGEDLCQPF